MVELRVLEQVVVAQASDPKGTEPRRAEKAFVAIPNRAC